MSYRNQGIYMTAPDSPHTDSEFSGAYERSDVNIRAMLVLGAGMVIGTAAVMAGLWLLWTSLNANARQRQPTVSPLADTQQMPREPRLQTTPIGDYREFQKEEEKLLHSYGWMDRAKGTVRIPIERAMELIAERGDGRSEGGRSEGGDEETRNRGQVREAQEYSVPRSQYAVSSPLITRSLVQQVGLDQRLGEQVPLDLQFRDEQGREVLLGDYFGQRPVILTLVYYRCPMLCTQVLNGVLRSSQAMRLQIGTDYDIVSVSIDPRETPAMAAAKKDHYVSRYRRAGAEKGWHFLTGDQSSIEALAHAVGYRYQYDEKSDQYAHPSGIVVLAPDGQVSRYFYGVDYPAGNLRLGLVESAQGKIGSPVDQILLLCFHYDPTTGKYGVVIHRVIRLAGVTTVLGLGTFLFAMYRLERRRTKNQESRTND
jgi:protein SCO1